MLKIWSACNYYSAFIFCIYNKVLNNWKIFTDGI